MTSQRYIRSSFILAIGLLATACDGAPQPGTNETILEPIQPGFAPAAPTHAIGGASEQQLAQTFTIVRDGTLAGVFLPVGCGSGQLEIEIRNVEGDEPGTTVLGSQHFSAESIVTDVTVFKLFRLPGLPVSAGDRLAMVLRNPTGSCGMASGPEGDPYPGGEAFFDARPNPPGWLRLFGRGVNDLAFQVMLEVS